MVGVPDDNPFSFALSRPSPPSPTGIHGSPFPSQVPSTSILRSARNSLDTSGSTSHTSDNLSVPLPPPERPPTHSAHSPSTVLGNYKAKEHDGSSPLYLDPPHNLPQKGNMGIARVGSGSSRSSGRDDEDDPRPKSKSKLPLRAAHSDVPRPLSHTHAHVDARLDARSSAGPRPSSVTSFFRRTVRRVRRPSGELDTGLGTTINGGQKGHNADVKRKRPQLARPVVLDLKPEADLDFFQKQSIMDNLEERLDAAKKLHGEAADLKMFYESETVAAMEELRATVIPRPLPQDNTLFKGANFVLAEIRGFYEELNKFWKEEICHVAEALKKRRTDLKDFECWEDFHSSLKLTIEFWKNRPPSGDAETRRGNNVVFSTGVDLGVIASSLSPTIGSFENALKRMSSCESSRYLPLGGSSFQRVYIAFAGNSDLCLSFLRHCADYGEKVMAWHPASAGFPACSHMGAPHDLRERSVGWSDVTGVSAKTEALEGAGSVGAILGSRTHLPHCLSAEMPPIHHPSPDQTLQSFKVSHTTDKDMPKPDIVITPPVGEHLGDRQRSLGQNILPQRASQSLLRFMCLPLKDKALVLLSIYVVVSLSLSLFKESGTTRSSGNHR